MNAAKSAAWFALGFAAVALAVIAATIYGFDQYERGWGPGGTMRISLWIVAIIAPLVAIGFGLGTLRFRAAALWWKPFLLGGAFVFAFAGLSAALASLSVDQNVRIAVFIVLTFGASVLAAKLLALWAPAERENRA